MELVDELEEWLKDPANRKELSAEELAALQSLDMEELKKLFEERMKEQKGRHQGGNRWIGTGGTSPFGQQGAHPFGPARRREGGGRSAMGIADARKYRPYRSDIILDIRQIEVALRKLRAFQREGQQDELDIDGTIDATAKNAGELEIVVRAPRKSNVRVLLLDGRRRLDGPAHRGRVAPVLGSEARVEHPRSSRPTISTTASTGASTRPNRFSEPQSLDDLLHELGPEWKLVMVGDAAMHPAELLGAGDYEYYATGQPRRAPDRAEAARRSSPITSGASRGSTRIRRPTGAAAPRSRSARCSRCSSSRSTA